MEYPKEVRDFLKNYHRPKDANDTENRTPNDQLELIDRQIEALYQRRDQIIRSMKNVCSHKFTAMDITKHSDSSIYSITCVMCGSLVFEHNQQEF